MAIHSRLIKENVAPSGADAIGVIQGGLVVGKIPLGTLARPSLGTKLYSFAALSDVHQTKAVNSYVSGRVEQDFKNVLAYVKDKVDFACICGDLVYFGYNVVANGTGSSAYNGNTEYSNEFQLFKDNVTASGFGKTIWCCAGNHDAWGGWDTMKSAWSAATGMGTSKVVTKTYGNDCFIFLSCDNGSKPFYTTTDIAALNTALNNNSDKRCFVFVHCFFPDRSGNYGNLYGGAISAGAELNALKSACDSHSNCIWFSGHSHWSFSHQGVDDTASRTKAGTTYGASKGKNYEANIYPANATADNSIWCVHLPSTGVPRDPNDNGFQEDMDAESEFAIVDVYQDYVEIKGYTLVSGDPVLNSPIYKQLPIATYLLKASGSNSSSGGGTTSGGSVSTSYDASSSTKYKAARGWLQRRSDGERADNPITDVLYDFVVQLSSDGSTWSNASISNIAISSSMAKNGTTIGGESGGNGSISYCSYTFNSSGTYTITFRNKETVNGTAERIYLTFTIII